MKAAISYKDKPADINILPFFMTNFTECLMLINNIALQIKELIKLCIDVIVGLVSLPTDQFYVEVPEAAFLLLTGGKWKIKF